MNRAGILGLVVMFAAADAYAAATTRLDASTMVSGTCAVAVPSVVPAGTATAAVGSVNVSCSSGSTYAVTVGSAPASGVPAANPSNSNPAANPATATITY